MTQALILTTTPKGVAPRTEDGNWGVVMLRRSGHDKVKQWFEFMPGFYQPAMRAEWPLGTMLAAVPPEVAVALIHRDHARIMTLDEAEEFNASLAKPAAAAKRKKEPEPEISLSSPAGETIQSGQGAAREPDPRPDPAGRSGSQSEPEEHEDQGADVLGEQPDAVEPEPERKTVTRRKRLG